MNFTHVLFSEYKITVSIYGGSSHDGTKGAQFVKIKGTEGETEELQCKADFSVPGQDVECTVSSSKNIGTYRCLIWRTTTTDGWGFTKVIWSLESSRYFLFVSRMIHIMNRIQSRIVLSKSVFAI